MCGKKVTVGVLHRIEEMADRPADFVLPGGKPFESLIPLPEVIAASTGARAESRKTQERYFAMLGSLGPEFSILRDVPIETLESSAGYAIGEGVRRLRAGKVSCLAGYDGEYGTVSLFAPDELEVLSGQLSLLEVGSVGKRKAKAASGLGRKKSESAAGEGDAGDAASFAPDPLNEEQAQAVTSPAAALAVIAGPGTGKTKTLVERIAHLVEARQVPPSAITAVTFTNQAAEEMRQRLESRLGGKMKIRGLTVGTFHAVCLAAGAQAPCGPLPGFGAHEGCAGDPGLSCPPGLPGRSRR